MDLPAAGRKRLYHASHPAGHTGPVPVDDPSAAEAAKTVAADAGRDQDRRPGDHRGRHSRHHFLHQRG